MEIRIGLSGFGYSGRTLHVPLILASGMDIVGVVSSNPAAVQKALPSAKVFADAETLMANVHIDVLVVATPNNTHEAQAFSALSANTPVVVDKPMAPSVAAIDRLTTVAHCRGSKLTAFHNRRWDSDYLTVRRLIQEGRLGAIHTFEAQWNRYRPQVLNRWREDPNQGGGILLDLGTHLIDQALALFGMPDWLNAEVYCQRTGAVADDSFDIRMGKDGLHMRLSSNSLAAAVAPRFVVHGSLGSFVKFGLDPQEAQMKSGLEPLSDTFGWEPEDQWGQLVIGANNDRIVVPSERGRWTDFYSSLRAGLENGTNLPVSLKEVRNVARVIEAVRSSSESGSTVRL